MRQCLPNESCDGIRHARVRRLLAPFLVLLALLGAAPAEAQDAALRARLASLRPKDFPAKPLEFVVPYGVGGGNDVHARIMAKYMEKYAGQTVVILNKPGAGGEIGNRWLATQAAADGYTLGAGTASLIADSVRRAEGKWNYRDLEPIGFINHDVLTWVVTPDGPFKDKNIKEIIAAAKEKPGTIRVASAENASPGTLFDAVADATGAKFIAVPYASGKQAQTDLVGGHIEVSFGYLGEYRGLLDAGRLRVVGVASNERTPLMPNAPTFNEGLGTKSIVVDAFRYVVVPKGVPAERKAWLEAVANASVEDPELVKEFAALGAVTDKGLNTSRKLADAIDRMAEAEQAAYDRQKKSGAAK